MAERGLHDLRRALQGEGDLGVDVEDVRLQDIHHACVWGLGDKEESVSGERDVVGMGGVEEGGERERERERERVFRASTPTPCGDWLTQKSCEVERKTH